MLGKNNAVIAWKYSSFINGKPMLILSMSMGKRLFKKILVRDDIVNNIFRVFVKCL